MLFKVFGDTFDDFRLRVSAAVNVGRIDVQLFCDVRDISPKLCQKPVVECTVEIGFCRESLQYGGADGGSAFVVVEVVICSAYAVVGVSPCAVQL